MAWSHSSRLGHKLHKNLEPPHVHSHNILSPLGSDCNSLHSLHSSVLHMCHHIHILHMFLVQGWRQRYPLDACCPCSWCWSTPHSRWGWHSSSHSGTSGDGSSHWCTTHQSPRGGPTPRPLGTGGGGGAAPRPLTGTPRPREGSGTPFK